jgi:hypothetical protein
MQTGDQSLSPDRTDRLDLPRLLNQNDDDMGNGTIPMPLGMPFHSGIDLKRFCALWKLDCHTTHPERRLVFIASPADAEECEAVPRICIAPSSLAGLSIDLAAAHESLLPDWNPILRARRHSLLETGESNAHGFVVLAAQIPAREVTDNSSVSDCNAARRVEDARYTQSLHQVLVLDGKSAEVFQNQLKMVGSYVRLCTDSVHRRMSRFRRACSSWSRFSALISISWNRAWIASRSAARLRHWSIE